ncbi:MAG: hypothetical protein WDW38_010364 [Sanguina aurantia]
MLPAATLETLHCGQLGLSKHVQFPTTLRFERLARICLLGAGPRIDLQALNDLLRAAPLLRSISVPPLRTGPYTTHTSGTNTSTIPSTKGIEGSSNSSSSSSAAPTTVEISDRCTATLLKELRFLHERMAAGFLLQGVTLSCQGKEEEEDDYLCSPRDRSALEPALCNTLSSLAALSTRFEAHHVSTCFFTSIDVQRTRGCWADLAQFLPNVTALQLSGQWDESDIEEGVLFPHLNTLQLASRLSGAPLFKLLASVPELCCLRLDNSLSPGDCNSLQAKLRETQAVVEQTRGMDMSCPVFSDWTPHSSTKDHFAMWARHRLAAAQPKAEPHRQAASLSA